MEQGAHIIVSKNGNGANVDVDLTDCTFEACHYMWQGITLQEDVKVSSYGKCVFKDATWAINSHSGSDFYLNKCDFTNNIFGISAVIETPFPEGNFTITHCNFNFSGALKASYPTQIPIGTHPTAGIYMENRHGIIGSNKYSANTFFDLNTGIQLINSTIQIYNANFEAIHTDGTFTDEYMGSAIYTNDEIGVSLNTFNPLLVDGTHFIGGISYPLVTFKDCDFGVYAKNAQTIIYNCKMENMITGFLAKGLTNLKKAYIGNSYIEANGVGIDYLLNPGALSLVANKNTIYSTHSKARCIAAEEAQLGNTQLEITENHLFNSGKTGVEVTYFELPVIKDNNISAYGPLNPDFIGINLSNCNKAAVACNNVLGGGKNAANVNNHGIRFNATSESEMDCNTVNQTTKGIGFYGPCGSTKMRDNKILNHNIGLFVNSTGNTGAQFYNGNQWLIQTSGPDYGAKNDNSNSVINDPFDVDNSGGQFQYLPSIDPSTLPGWFNNFPGTNYTCSAVQCDSKKVVSNISSGLSLEMDIADGTYNTAEYNNESTDLARLYLYNKLNKDSALRVQFSAFQLFYNAYQNTNISNLQSTRNNIESLNQYSGYFATVIKTADSILTYSTDSLQLLDSLRGTATLSDSVIDGLSLKILTKITTVQNLVQQAIAMQETRQGLIIDAALLSNNLIQSSNLVEQNHQIINKIYLQTIAKGIYTFTSGQVDSIIAVAEQCPYSGGSAVYRARVMYRLANPTMEYNDFASCLSEGYFRKAATQNLEKEFAISDTKIFGMAPNPASEEVLIYFENKNHQNAILEIQNCLGEKIGEQALTYHQNKHVLNTSTYKNGLYYVRISSPEYNTPVQKLVILK